MNMPIDIVQEVMRCIKQSNVALTSSSYLDLPVSASARPSESLPDDESLSHLPHAEVLRVYMEDLVEEG